MVRKLTWAAAAAAGSVVLALGVPAAGLSMTPVGCVAPVNSSSPARCTFDIWGYVTLNGSAVAGAEVTDGAGQVVQTDSSGFYDLNELEPGQYQVTASAASTTGECLASQSVDDSALNAAEYGGTEADFALPPQYCS